MSTHRQVFNIVSPFSHHSEKCPRCIATLNYLTLTYVLYHFISAFFDLLSRQLLSARCSFEIES